MKISKSKKQAQTLASKTADVKYEDAMTHIQAAIDCLGKVAVDDKVARDSIANLGVVALDLSSNK